MHKPTNAEHLSAHLTVCSTTRHPHLCQNKHDGRSYSFIFVEIRKNGLRQCLFQHAADLTAAGWKNKPLSRQRRLIQRKMRPFILPRSGSCGSHIPTPRPVPSAPSPTRDSAPSPRGHGSSANAPRKSASS